MVQKGLKNYRTNKYAAEFRLLMDFNNIWQQCVSEQNGVIYVYLCSYAQCKGRTFFAHIIMHVHLINKDIKLKLNNIMLH